MAAIRSLMWSPLIMNNFLDYSLGDQSPYVAFRVLTGVASP
ncbi:hypothetical protein NMY3_01578 [Candidatus Nitrosocosmicus oleophilus]|uniref:Uncharacterized protein n=1 Tax=Candidatus Nitrosocosmicus oleophilus TaxID=1353260 RepID=A0A654LZT8_9ARCH|nr:hypothetical protein NMY3_01578 [Candidatus Nitrosocosmicus oleophilus]